MKRLVPWSTQPSAVGVAVVCTPATSEPAPAPSARMQQIASPWIIRGRWRRFCVSEALRSSMSHMSLQRSWESATAAAPRASSS